jgi:hypothetical protein
MTEYEERPEFRLPESYGGYSWQMYPQQRLNEDQIQVVVSSACMQFASQTGVDVSPPAQFMIGRIFNAFILDPHPDWNIDAQQHLEHANQLLSSMPQYLHDIRERIAPRETITPFDVLHWFAMNIQDICPYISPFS